MRYNLKIIGNLMEFFNVIKYGLLGLRLFV